MIYAAHTRSQREKERERERERETDRDRDRETYTHIPARTHITSETINKVTSQ